VDANAQEVLENTPEFDYLTHIVLRMYENKNVPVHAPERFRVEISFSPGERQERGEGEEMAKALCCPPMPYHQGKEQPLHTSAPILPSGAAYNPVKVKPQLGDHVFDVVPRIPINIGTAETLAEVEGLLAPLAKARKVSPSIYALQVRAALRGGGCLLPPAFMDPSPSSLSSSPPALLRRSL
jgi:hypothetical protein